MNETLRRDGAWRRGQVPYGGPIVEMDALIGVKSVRCLGCCQINHPTGEFFQQTFTPQVWEFILKGNILVFVEQKLLFMEQINNIQDVKNGLIQINH